MSTFATVGENNIIRSIVTCMVQYIQNVMRNWPLCMRYINSHDDNNIIIIYT